ncbi:flowering time control protein FCA-like isoform X2 [Curcuma longa]|uniref:flowering time control protein FCA-like isoform X2 n=1 Tax=Curcuma longa TaxID=136217 RepID=UPI003D9F8795
MDRHRNERFDDRFGDDGVRHVPSRWSSGSPTDRQPRYPRSSAGSGGEGFTGGSSGAGGRYHPYRAMQDVPPPPAAAGFPGGEPGGFGLVPPASGPRRGFSSRGGSPDRTGGNKFAKLFIGAVPRTATEEDIRPLFEEHGYVIEVAFIKDRKTGEQQGCCFVKYATSEEADKAIRALHNQYTLPGGSGPIQVRYADGDRNHPGVVAEDKLFVASLGKQATAKEIEDVFSPYGQVVDVYIMRDSWGHSRGCGFVKFTNREMAAAAMNALDGSFVMRGCDQPLVVRFADPKRPRTADQRNGPAFGGPGVSPRSDAALVIRPTANLDELRNGPKPADAWHPLSPAGQSNSHGSGGVLPIKGGPLGTSSDPSHFGSTVGSNVGPVSSPSVPPSSQGFNPSMATVSPFGSQQISALQKPMVHLQNFPPPPKLHAQQGPLSHPLSLNLQVPLQHFGQHQLLHSGGLSSNQNIPSQQLPGVSGQVSSQPLTQQITSSMAQQTPSNPQAQAMPANANLPQFATSNVTPQMLQQPIQPFPSQLPQMLLQQQAQALQSSFQSSQQAIFQLQQQLQQMQQHQTLSEGSKLQAASTAASTPASAIPTTVSSLPVPVNSSLAVPITCNWTEHTSPDGFKYYYNSVTQESKWEKPEELAVFEQQQQQQKLLLLQQHHHHQQQQQQQQHQQKLSFQQHPSQFDTKSHLPIQLNQQVLPAQVQPQMMRQQAQLQVQAMQMYQVSGGAQPHGQDFSGQVKAAGSATDPAKIQQGIPPAQEWALKNKPSGTWIQP